LIGRSLCEEDEGERRGSSIYEAGGCQSEPQETLEMDSREETKGGKKYDPES
jgi:hypothetical protein